MAANVRAHCRLLRELERRSSNPGDYGDAWAPFASTAKRATSDHDVRVHASRKARAKLDGPYDLATSRGPVAGEAAGTEKLEDDAERRK